MKKLLAIFMASAMTLPTLSVGAAALNEAEVNFSNNTVTISGEVGSEYANRFISLQVLNPGKDFSKLFTEDGVLNRSEQSFVKDDGSFEFTFTMKGKSGDYSYFVGVDGMNDTLESSKPFTYYDVDFINGLWIRLKNAIDNKNDTELASILKDYASPLKIDTSEYLSFGDDAKERIRKGIIRNDVNDIDDLSTVFNDAVATYKLYAETDDDTFNTKLAEYIEKSEDVIKELYQNKLSDGKRAEVVSEIRSSHDWYNEKDVLNLFKNSVRLKLLNGKVLWTEINTFITTEACFTADEISTYKSSTKKQSISTELLKRLPYTSIDTFLSDLKELSKPSGGGNGGGGGGTSGFTSGVGEKYPDVDLSGSGYADDNISAEEVVFDDLDGFEWALSDISKLKGMGIVNGYENKFNPESSVTRAEFLKMAVLTANISTDVTLSSVFDDVSADEWYAPYVIAAVNADVVSGVGDGKFDPDGSITRQDIAVILINILKSKGKPFAEGEKMPDDYNDIADYARESVCKLMNLGIVNGYTDGTFKGHNEATRAEAAVLISRFADLLQ